MGSGTRVSDDASSDEPVVLHAYGETTEIPTDDCDPVAAILVAEERCPRKARRGGEGSTGRGGVCSMVRRAASGEMGFFRP